jgi:predicted phage replisome organizer
MADVKWIKLHTGMFDNSKIKYIRTLPEGNNIVLIWVMLLAKAGKCNSNGFIFLTENIPYTPKMLSAEFDFDISIIELALATFNKLGMIHLEEQKIMITGWNEHQNIEGLERIRQQTRKRVADYRKKQKLLPCNVTSNVTVTQSNAIEEDKEEDIDIYNISKDILCNKNLLPIVEAWNNLKLSKLITIKSNSNRFKLLQARIKEVGIDKVIETINSINNSSFLKGQNNKGWVITFDWLIKPNNFIKVLEGNYLDKGGDEYGNNRVRSFGQNTGKSESQFQVKINTRNHQLTAEDEARAERELI